MKIMVHFTPFIWALNWQRIQKFKLNARSHVQLLCETTEFHCGLQLLRLHLAKQSNSLFRVPSKHFPLNQLLICKDVWLQTRTLHFSQRVTTGGGTSKTTTAH